MSRSVRAALFDVDGTLVDTNYLHAVTWWEAFGQAGFQLVMADIHRAIGMGSDLMLDELLPADRDKDADAAAFAGDVESSRPAPDLVQAALDRVGMPPADAVFTGDTVWDVQACRKAGVPCIGLLSGGISRDELMAAGAVEVYPGPAELLAGIHASPLGGADGR
jgi:phosphoglycolate phosphatase-like HAD superfamily hydrolase